MHKFSDFSEEYKVIKIKDNVTKEEQVITEEELIDYLDMNI